MKLENNKVNSRNLYCIGYCSNIDKYILECCVPGSVYYNMYYEISKEEFDRYEEDSSELDKLVDYIRRNNYKSDRLLFSDLSKDNSIEQAELMKKAKQKQG
ncbi:MAG: ABC transporter ATP-binding protein [Lachnospiraceae bacterium]|nr:ABC transporter ATP-binding protein [Lachnospiraceae bacterium]